MNKCLLVLCHSRAAHVEKCLESFFSARGSEEYRVVVVRQVGFDDVRDVVETFRSRLSLLIELEGDDSPEESIRRNRFIGYFACYQTLDSEIVLAMEDDVCISTDALEFIEQAYVRYESNRHFMGINLGSVEPLGDELVDSYSLVRYGIHGQASVLARRTWKRLLKSRIITENPGGHFDSAIEGLLKRGFMVTPNNSRHLDFGYGGTHAPERTDNDYFSRIHRSWVGESVVSAKDFHLKQIRHHWREDAVAYRWWANPYYRLVDPVRRRLGGRRGLRDIVMKAHAAVAFR
jgi:hypothetical protein